MAAEDMDARADSSTADQGNGGIAAGLTFEEAATQTLPGRAATSQSVEETESQGAGADDAGDSAPPFHEHPRWKEMQAKLKAAEAKVADADTLRQRAEASENMAQVLRDMGYHSPEEARSAMEEARIQRELQAELDSFLKTPQPDLQRKIDAQEMTVEQALREHEARAKARMAEAEKEKRLEIGLRQLAEQRIDDSIYFFSQAGQYPDADFAAIRERALAQSAKTGFNPRAFVEREAKASHEKFQQRVEQGMANAAHKAAGTKAPPSNDKNGAGEVPGAGQKPRVGVPNPLAFARKVVSRPWEDLLGIK